MGQKADEMSSDEIKKNIDLERAYLGRDLQQLDEKLSATLDWRVHVEKNLRMLLAFAFGTGLLLSTLIGRRHR